MFFEYIKRHLEYIRWHIIMPQEPKKIGDTKIEYNMQMSTLTGRTICRIDCNRYAMIMRANIGGKKKTYYGVEKVMDEPSISFHMQRFLPHHLVNV